MHLEIENRLMLSTWTSRKSQKKLNPEIFKAWRIYIYIYIYIYIFFFFFPKDMCPWYTRKHHAGLVPMSSQSSLQYSVQSSVHYSVQSSAHLGNSRIHLGHLCTQLQHIWNMEHSWATSGVYSKCTSGHIWKHLEHSWTHLDTPSIQSNAHLVCCPRVHPSVQCSVHSSVHPVYCPSCVQSRVLSSVYPRYNPVYISVYRPLYTPAIQCTAQYTPVFV